MLARFWGDVLKIAAPGAHDDLAELGGNSLHAAQIIARVQDLFPFARPLATPVQTIEELARFIVANETNSGQSEKIAELFLKVESLSDAEVAEALAKLEGAPSDG